MNKITLLFFATLKDLAGTRRAELEIEPGANIAALKAQLVERFPRVKPALEYTVISIDREYAFDQDEIPDGAEVAFFPPVSGGAMSFSWRQSAPVE